MLLPLATLDDTAARSVRAGLDFEHADRLAAALRAGRSLPPVLALRDDDAVLVYDGAHRLEGYRQAFPLLVATLKVEVEIRGEGGPAEALALALGCNREHGLPLSRTDLQHRRELVLVAEEQSVRRGVKRRSSRALAAVIGCSHTYVSEWWTEHGIKTRRAPKPAPVAVLPGQQLLTGGEVETDAAVRERLDLALSVAERLGVESFDLPDEPGQIVIHWREGLDDEPRDRLDAALVAVEAANARARFEAIRASHPHLTVEIACPPLDTSSPSSLTETPPAGDVGASRTSPETVTAGSATTAPPTASTPTPPAGTTSPASTATTELERRAAVHRLLVEQAVDAGHMELAEARRTGADAGRIAAITAGVHGMQQYLADRWIPAWSPEPSDEDADASALLKVNAAVDVVGRQHRLDAAVGRERQALARAEAAEREAAQLRIRAAQVAVLEADLQRAHERADKAEAEKRWAIASSTQAMSEAVKFAQAQIDALQSEVAALRAELAGRPLPVPAEALPEPAAAAPTEREPRWLATVRERLGAEPDEDVAWDAGPGVRAADVRRERERLGIPEYVAPKPAPDPMAIYRPWRGSADEFAAQLNALEPDELERVRVTFGVPVCRDVVGRLLAKIQRVAP